MVVFKEKLFWVGAALKAVGMGSKAAGGFMVGTTGVSIAQGAKGNKLAKEQGAEQERIARQQTINAQKAAKEQNKIIEEQMKAQTKALQKAAKNKESVQPIPPPTEQTGGAASIEGLQSIFSIPEERNFGIGGSILKGINKFATSDRVNKIANNLNKKGWIRDSKEFVKDTIALGKERGSGQKIMNGLAMGGSMALAGYGVDKVIQADRKKLGAPVDQQQGEKKKKSTAKKIGTGILAGLGAAGAGVGTIALARRGKLNSTYLKQQTNKLGDMAGLAVKKQLTPGALAMSVGMGGALTGIPYLAERKQLKDQANQSQQKQYSFLGTVFGNKKDTALTNNRLGQAGKESSGVFVMGKKDRAILQNQMGTKGKYMKTLSKFVNPKNALLGTAVGAGLMSATYAPWGWGEKATKKALGTADKKAFAYENSKNQQV